MKSISKPDYHCFCGEPALYTVPAGHNLDLYLCEACKATLEQGEPLKLEFTAPHEATHPPGDSN